jgi:hypothetical protein
VIHSFSFRESSPKKTLARRQLKPGEKITLLSLVLNVEFNKTVTETCCNQTPYPSNIINTSQIAGILFTKSTCISYHDRPLPLSESTRRQNFITAIMPPPPSSSSTQQQGRGGFTSFQDAINKETIKKEMQYHRLHDKYVDPPKRKST